MFKNLKNTHHIFFINVSSLKVVDETITDYSGNKTQAMNSLLWPDIKDMDNFSGGTYSYEGLLYHTIQDNNHEKERRTSEKESQRHWKAMPDISCNLTAFRTKSS
jgi:hypothetical protein